MSMQQDMRQFFQQRPEVFEKQFYLVTMSYQYEEDDLEKSLQEAAFRRGLRNTKLIFLEDLKSLVLGDPELRMQTKAIDRAFKDMASYISSKPTSLLNMELRDFDRFGFSENAIRRIGQLSVQLESSSPKSNPAMRRLNSNNNNNNDNLSFSRQSSLGDDHYEEDFEEILDEDEDDGGTNPLPTPYRRVDDIDTNDEIDSDEDAHLSGSSRHIHEIHGSPLSRHRHHTEQYRQQQQLLLQGQTPSHNASFKATAQDEAVVEDDLVGMSHYKSNINVHNSSFSKPKVSSSVHFPSSATPPVVKSTVTPTNINSSINKIINTNNTSVAVSSSASVSGSTVRRKRKKTPDWITQRRFTLGKQIGEGSFGKVYEAMNDMGIIVAVKRMNFLNKTSEVDDLLSEIDLMRGLSHQNIVEYLGAIVDADQCCLYIFQEWVSRGSVQGLLKDLGPFPMSVVRNYTRQILLGLEYLHEQGIVHRDIKGGNILVHNDGNVKLADFGASKKLGMDRTIDDGSAIKGTPYFMAPEVLSQGHYGRKGDIWAVGCTMIQMFTGEPPWKDRNLRGIMQLHALLLSWDRGPPPCSSPHPISTEAQECLQLCFRKAEAERPTASQLLQCLFLRDIPSDFLEDSNGSQSCEASFYGRDHLEESATIRKLREEISSAQVSKSQQNYGGLGHIRGFSSGGIPHPSDGGSESDLIGRVDRQLQQNNNNINNNKPSVVGIRSSIQQQQQQQQQVINNSRLPPPSQQFLSTNNNNNYNNNYDYYNNINRIDTFTPRDNNNNNNNNNVYGTPQSTARTILPSEANTPQSIHKNNNNMHANPFGSPARLISPTHIIPNNNVTSSNNNGNPFGRRAESRPSSQQSTVHTHLQPIAAANNPYINNNNNTNIDNNNPVIRDSLSQLKRKVQNSTANIPNNISTNNYNRSRAGSYSDGINLSSQRDSEDMTPPLSDYEQQQQQPPSRRGSSRSGSVTSVTGGLQRDIQCAREMLQEPPNEYAIDEKETCDARDTREREAREKEAKDKEMEDKLTQPPSNRVHRYSTNHHFKSHYNNSNNVPDSKSVSLEEDEEVFDELLVVPHPWSSNMRVSVAAEAKDTSPIHNNNLNSTNNNRPGLQRFDTRYFEDKGVSRTSNSINNISMDNIEGIKPISSASSSRRPSITAVSQSTGEPYHPHHNHYAAHLSHHHDSHSHPHIHSHVKGNVLSGAGHDVSQIGVMRKSSSASDSIAVASVSARPGYSGSHNNNHNNGHINSHNINSNSGVRGSVGEVVRPYTSKASLASMTPSTSTSTSATNHSHKMVSPRVSPRDTHIPPITSSATTTTTASTAEQETEEQEEGAWKCLKCSESNSNPVFCDFCATRRGGTGARGLHAVIPRF